MVPKLYLWIYLECITHAVLFSAPITLFLFVFCHNYLLLWKKLFSVTNTIFCEQILLMWQKLVFVTETCFCGKTCFCDRNLFLQQKLSVTKTSFCVIKCPRNKFLGKYIFVFVFYVWFQWKSFCEELEFPLSRIIEIITLWNPAYTAP